MSNHRTSKASNPKRRHAAPRQGRTDHAAPAGVLGRPRDPGVEAAVIAATLDHLAEHGYQGMSMDAIATAAGVGKPSIYRRWPSKADLATAALSALQSQEDRVVGRDTRQRLVSHLRGFRKSLLRRNGMAMLGTILAEEHRTPELMQLFRRRIVVRRRQLLEELLEQGVVAGEIRPGADIDAAVNLLVGSFYARYLAGQAISDEWPERAVAVIWPAIASRDSAA